MNTIELAKEYAKNVKARYSFKHHIRQAYIAGHRDCASAMNGSAGVWVNADDRLPEFKEREKRYVVRYVTHPENFELWKWDWINERQANGYQIEWLDTSVSSPSPLEAETADKPGDMREQIFDKMARAGMDSYELSGFKRTHPTLFKVIMQVMQEYGVYIRDLGRFGH